MLSKKPKDVRILAADQLKMDELITAAAKRKCEFVLLVQQGLISKIVAYFDVDLVLLYAVSVMRIRAKVNFSSERFIGKGLL